MKINFKFTALVLLLCIMIQSFTALASATDNTINDDKQVADANSNMLPEVLDRSVLEVNGHTKRLYEDEAELNVAAFGNNDGTNSMYIFDENIKYVDKNSKVVDKSNQLYSNRDGYTNLHNDVNVLYPTMIDNGIRLSYEDYNITMRPLSELASASKLELESSKNKVVNNTIKYAGVYNKYINMVYTQQFSGFKEDIVITQKNDITRFSFEIKTSGLKLVLDEDKVLFLDDGKTVAYSSPICMWDSNNVYGQGSYEIKELKENDSYILTIVADDFLNNRDLQYPVTIDPSITIGKTSATAIEDATIFTNYQTNFGQWISLFVGNYNAWTSNASQQRGTARTLVKFPGLMNNDTFKDYYNKGCVTSIKYNVADIDCLSGPNTINAYLATASWVENTVVKTTTLWNAKGTYIGSTTIKPTAEVTRYEIDITLAVKNWFDTLSTPSNNNGIMLKANNETLEAVVLSASEIGESNTSGSVLNKPYVVVNYNTKMDGMVYKIKNVASSKYMHVANGYDVDNVNVYQYQTHDTLFAQEFLLQYDSVQAAYRIRPICSRDGSGRVLDVVKSGSGVSGLTSGCNLQIYKPVDDIAQLFEIKKLESGYYKIVLKHAPNLALTAYGTSNGSPSGTSSTSAGNIYVSNYTGATSQQWIFEVKERHFEQLYYAQMNIAYPFIGSNIPVRISSDFGYRKDPMTQNDRVTHSGIDIPATGGTLLYSAFDGVVKKIGYDSSRGHYIIVEASNDYNNVYNSNPSVKLRYVYMHMQEAPNVTNASIVEEASVSKGTIVGKVGTSGNSTGNHLHYGIIIDGGLETSMTHCIDPMTLYPDIDFTY